MADSGESSTIRNELRKHQRYLMVYIAFVELFIVMGPLYNYSILFLSFQKEFHTSAALTGWVGSIANAIFGICGPLCAPLILRFGLRTMTLVSSVIFSIGLAATSFVPSLLYAYFTFGILVGVGAGTVVQAVMTLVVHWFPGKSCTRGLAMALVGTSCCVLTFVPLFNTLTSAYGWRNALRIVSGGSLVITLVHGCFIVEPEQVETSKSITEEGGGYKMVETDIGEKDDGDQPRVVTETVGKRIYKLLHQSEAWLWLTAGVLLNIGWTFVAINFASFMEYDLHFTANQISITFVLFAVGEIIGKCCFSAFGGRIPFLKLYCVAAGSLLGGAASGVMILLRTVPLMYTVAALTGLFRSACYTMSFIAGLELFGEYGADIVVMIPNIPYAIGVLIGAPVSGVLYDLTGDYTLSLLVVLATFACSVALMLAIPVRRRIKLTWKKKRRRNNRKVP
ncbi:monocarboxylate transporter 13-like [Asterias amurensis]|uniref:monocarboxylate transporter 13-like n=1 Tax=Asterias amurensis TaxID=7602 RepID=UPI003AB768B0